MVRATSSNVLRRITTLLIISCLLTVGLCVNTATALPGSGTQEDPYRIESLADFDEFAADPNYWSGFTRLETDVNLAGRTYTTAVIAPDKSSSYEFQGTSFTGVFDGNAHKITNLTMHDFGAGNDFMGLFGHIEDGEVKNLGLEGGSVSGDEYVGGLVAWNKGSVSNCYSNVDISGEWIVGGLVGKNVGSVSGCHSTGSIIVSVRPVGGLVGHNEGNISNCYSTGDVSGSDIVGGLVGYNAGSVLNCYSTGNISGQDVVGGLMGINDLLGTVLTCYSNSSATGYNNCVAGLVAINDGDISNCYSTGNVNGTAWVGGLVGSSDYGYLSNCHSTGDVNANHTVGGLLGRNVGNVSNCYSTGSVSANHTIGGLVGANGDGDHPGGQISNCYSTGDVSGTHSVGGLVGRNGLRDLDRGIHTPGYIFNTYSVGSVQGTSNVGGLVGNNEVGGIEGSLWDVQTSGEPNMCGLQTEYATGCDPNCGKTTVEMQTKSTFTDAGWDFVEIWLINEGATYPVLRQEIRSDLNGIGGVNLLDFAVFADHWLEGKDE